MSIQLQIIIQVARPPVVHLSFHGVELIAGLQRSQACPCPGTSHRGGTPNKPWGSAITMTMPLVRKSMDCGAPQTISLTSQGRQKWGQAAKIQTGTSSLTCWLGTWLSLYLELFSWFKKLLLFAYTLKIRIKLSEVWGIICCLMRLWVPFWDGFRGWSSGQSWTAAQGDDSVWVLCRGGVLGLSCVPWRNYQC